MTGRDDTDIAGAGTRWRARPTILAAIGLVSAIIAQQLLDGAAPLPAGRVAVAALVGTGATAFGFAVERARWRWAVAFAVAAAVVAGLVVWWNGPGGAWPYIWSWPYASLFLAIAIAAPLFQTARDEGGWRFPYPTVHRHAWTNVVLWFACWAFVGIVFLLAWLLAALFDLIGIDLLIRLLEKDWVAAGLLGAALGGSLGLLRERDRVIRLLQRVVTAVLGVLAPVLGTGLALFLVALPFTGLDALWDATKSTTPILLGCIIAALILSNAVIGDGPEDVADDRALRWGATALALVILPLAVIAAIATALRVGQYGFTPDRLWALTFVAIACAYGIAYLAAVIRRRQGWADAARPANLGLAFVLGGIALFLATPILSFNAISTRDQVARLETGRIAPEKFDWAALAFDFGEPGRRAVRRLAASHRPDVARLAGKAASADNRWSLTIDQGAAARATRLDRHLRILPRQVPLPVGLREKLADFQACGSYAEQPCTVLWQPGRREAIAISGDCAAGAHACTAARLRFDGKAWQIGDPPPPHWTAARRTAVAAALARGEIEVRTVQRRQVFIGGIPVEDPFE
jgi:hypothetical protein